MFGQHVRDWQWSSNSFCRVVVVVVVSRWFCQSNDYLFNATQGGSVGCWSWQKKRVLDFIERKARCYFFPTLFPNCFRVQIFSFNPFIIIISARFTGMIEWLLSLYARTFWFSHTDRVCVTPRRYVGRQTSHIKHETISFTSLFISKIILPTSYFYTLVD